MTDQGCGIPPELLDDVFKPYVTGRAGGHGLGLPIVKGLVDSLDGAELVMGHPRDEGLVLKLDKPWEGRYSGYGVVMQVSDSDYRYYYRGSPRYVSTKQEVETQTCLALSKDGIHWERPEFSYNTDAHYFGKELSRTERPHILWKDGEPEYLFLANHGSREAGFYLKIENWK